MKIISYNVNGIRAALRKGFLNWLQTANPDILCIQETKANPEQFDVLEFEKMGYHHYWFSAQKKGYSGVGILTKKEPNNIVAGCGLLDNEGRVLRVDFDNFSVMSLYLPSGTNLDRLETKLTFMSDFQEYVNRLKKEIPNIIISGDYNICHRAIDIHDPIRNAKVSGFLPVERQWLDEFINSGFIDSFRHFVQQGHHYSWWSYRAYARANNKGWRIDYNLASKPLENRLQRAYILPEAKHSDHCPVVMELKK